MQDYIAEEIRHRMIVAAAQFIEESRMPKGSFVRDLRLQLLLKDVFWGIF